MNFAWIAAGVVVVLLGGSYLTYRFVFCTSNRRKTDIHSIPKGEQYQKDKQRMLELIDTLDAVAYEQVCIRSKDGLKLVAKYYHRHDNAPLAICFHGYRSTGIRDFSGGVQIAFRQGQNVLLVDQRAQGLSEGHTMTFGVMERYDCLAWIDYAVQRFGAETKIALYGVSMGAATVLMASGLELPENVVGIVADCPYTTPPAIIQKVCRDVKLPVAVIYPFIAAGAFLFGRFRLSDGSAVEAVKQTAVPILIIHGEDDRFVPCEMSREIQNANPEMVRRYTFAYAGHGLSYIVDPERYETLVKSFLHMILEDNHPFSERET